MSTTPDVPQPYPTCLWDYADDFSTTPSGNDRRRLVRRAEDDPREQKRIAIWDFFFPVLSEEVGKPQKLEREGLQAELRVFRKASNKAEAKLQRKIEKTQRRIERDRQETRQKLEAERAALLKAPEEKIEKSSGLRSRLMVGVVLLGLFSLVSLGVGKMRPCVLFAIGTVISGVLAWRSKADADQLHEKAQADIESLEQDLGEGLAARVAELQSYLEERKVELVAIRLDLEDKERSVAERCSYLEQRITELIEQIPSAPSPTRMLEWLMQDLAELSESAIEVSGFEGSLLGLRVKARTTGGIQRCGCDPIVGPAELQEPAELPISCVHHEDRKTHLRARKFYRFPDGRFADFYGIYKLQFIVVAEHGLATFETYFDFISGERLTERTGIQHYADVVMVQAERNEQKVEIQGQTEFVSNLPSLAISLTSGDPEGGLR